MGIVNAANNV